MKKYWVPLLAGAVMLLGALLMWSSVRVGLRGAAVPVTPSLEPLVPTRTPVGAGPVMATLPFVPTDAVPVSSRPTFGAGDAVILTLTPVATVAQLAPTTALVTSLPEAVGFRFSEADCFRFGVSMPYGVPSPDGVYDLASLKVGWVMDWQVRERADLPAGVEYVQTVRMSAAGLRPDAATLTAVAAANPGATWLISNEPDVRWQDNVTPEVYARLYHEAYTALKAGDAAAVVAAGGIAQATPLRLRYLDRVLGAYQAEFGALLPAQAWQIHNYILREERDSWGVDIPPGLADATGMLYDIDDSGNMTVFRQQVVDFRRWMLDRGYGGLPLIISEFGVPMPADYGFPPERMAEFLRESWQFFLTATDSALGVPGDGGRLVQRWCWFSMGHPPYPTGDLIDFETGGWTPLGRVWIGYVGGEE